MEIHRREAVAVLIGDLAEFRPERLTARERLAVVAENAGCILDINLAVHIDIGVFCFLGNGIICVACDCGNID